MSSTQAQLGGGLLWHRGSDTAKPPSPAHHVLLLAGPWSSHSPSPPSTGEGHRALWHAVHCGSIAGGGTSWGADFAQLHSGGKANHEPPFLPLCCSKNASSPEFSHRTLPWREEAGDTLNIQLIPSLQRPVAQSNRLLWRVGSRALRGSPHRPSLQGFPHPELAALAGQGGHLPHAGLAAAQGEPGWASMPQHLHILASLGGGAAG